MGNRRYGNSLGETLGVLTPGQLQDEFNISTGTQANMRSSKKLPHIKLGGTILYYISDIEEILLSHRVNNNPAKVQSDK